MLQIDVSAIGTNCIQITSETIHSLLLAERTEAQEDIWPLCDVFGTTTAQDSFFTTILKNKGKLVCDGSGKHHETSSAFLTTDIPGCGGTNIIPGRRKEQTPYRAELGGILGGFLYTNEISKKRNIGTQTGQCELACDCKGAVDAITAILNGAAANSTWSLYDILILIKHQLDISSIKWTMRHVGGHMDDEKDWKDLDIWEQTNVRALCHWYQYETKTRTRGRSMPTTHIYECTTDETTVIFETNCLELKVTIDSKGLPGMSLAISELLRAARAQTEPNFDIII